MGGGGGRVSYPSIKKDLDSIEKDIKSSDYISDVAAFLNKQLANFNDRDARLTSARLDRILGLLAQNGQDVQTLLFGGSVAKHTYVDGISDIDVLIGIEGGDSTPAVVKKNLAEMIADRLGGEATVSTGRLAITVAYSDGMQVQLLPAVKKDDGKLAIPSASGKDWSLIDPKGFANALTKANERMAGKLVPAIKVIKAINSTLPEQNRLSGYHVESLAIEVFKGYKGEKTLPTLVKEFFEKSRDRVLEPIRDKTGQSLHVDEYLGKKRSEERRVMNAVLDRIARRLKLAETTKDVGKWQEFFE